MQISKETQILLLLWSWILIHPLKLFSAVIFSGSVPPFHFLLLMGTTVFIFFLNRLYRKKEVLALNTIYSIYVGVGLLGGDHLVSSVRFKFAVAGYVFFNLFFCLAEICKEHHLREFFLLKFREILKYGAWIVLTILIVVFFASFFRYSSDYTITDILGLFKFPRGADAVALRLDAIQRLNIVTVFTKHRDVMAFAGPQILLYPFMFLIVLLTQARFRLNRITIGFISITSFFTIVINSRAMVLIAVILLIGRFFKLCPKLIIVSSLLSFLFPWLLLYLPPDWANGRYIQQDYVLKNFSFFGHGVGDGLEYFLATINTVIFDNAHLEFLHYFGAVFYFLAIFFLMRGFQKFNFYDFALLVFINIFMALNFNLFEVVFVPIIFYFSCLSELEKSVGDVCSAKVSQ